MAWTVVSDVPRLFGPGEQAAYCYGNTYTPRPNNFDCSYLNVTEWGITSPTVTSFSELGYGGYAEYHIGLVSDVRAAPGGFVGAPAGGGTTVVEFGAPFNLTPEQGWIVGGAIVGVFLIAFIWKAFVRALDPWINTDREN